MTEKLPIGWLDLVTDLRFELMRDYPGVAVTEMTADRGWLHVRVDDGGLDPAARYRLDRMLQGYVTQSLTTCMCCGSHEGHDRGERREITCETCEEECCDADA
ncbi:hypothetical protein [Rhizobium leguminosarum]|uniref:hypothetical protein n=1 Tax=Rhizobium leguminosarum TaxID=384 RepID=UPI001C93CCC4|nr:hypothetical protein [Rhizobium leguminosarum]MBY5462102.1 hypothetical protein [Rhizobium leguminosarum]